MCKAIGCPHPNYLGTERWPLTSDEFTDWLAVNELKPFANEWLQTAIIASEAHNAGVMQCRQWGLPVDSLYSLTTHKDFLPTSNPKKRKRPKGRRLSAREAELEMRARHGM